MRYNFVKVNLRFLISRLGSERRKVWMWLGRRWNRVAIFGICTGMKPIITQKLILLGMRAPRWKLVTLRYTKGRRAEERNNEF
jgi:hypothetical protein